jgi:2-methylcitrate dehydratase PrpD
MAEKTPDASKILAEHILRVRYDDLPQDAVEVTKKSILDTIGVILGASGLVPSIRPIVEMAEELGGKEESTLIGFGVKCPAPMAAFVNGAMAHCLDYDDIHHSAKIHPSTSIVPAALAVAERRGKTAGKDLIRAIAIGADISTRIGLSSTWRFPWHMSPLTGQFSAAAACSKLLGLKADQIRNAFGIALCQAAGSMELRWGVDSDLGGMYAAFPAKGGVLSAMLAQKGITGIQNSFEGRAGFFNLYFQGEYKRDILLADLGKRFEGVNTGFKPWPACAYTHVYIDAALQLAKEKNLRVQDIDEVVIYVGDVAQNLCEPLEARRAPKTILDAKFSLPYTVAVAILNRDVRLKDYTVDALQNKEVLAMAKKVVPKFDSHFNIARAFPPGKVEIRTVKGQTHVLEVEHPYGHPTKPLSRDTLIDKFRDCASLATRPLSLQQVERVTGLLTNLEEVEDVNDIMRLLS